MRGRSFLLLLPLLGAALILQPTGATRSGAPPQSSDLPARRALHHRRSLDQKNKKVGADGCTNPNGCADGGAPASAQTVSDGSTPGNATTTSKCRTGDDPDALGGLATIFMVIFAFWICCLGGYWTNHAAKLGREKAELEKEEVRARRTMCRQRASHSERLRTT